MEYQSTVILGSIPFIAILTWQARYFGLARYKAFLISLLLCGCVMLFPWSLNSGWKVSWWSLIIISLIFSSLFMSGFRSRIRKVWFKVKTITKLKAFIGESKEKVSTVQKSVNSENLCKEELIAQVQNEEQGEYEEEYQQKYPAESQEEFVIEKRQEEPDKETLIQQLIENGFKEKFSDNFDEAVYFFSKALSLDPKPDLALYLIIDCFWLWNNLGKRDFASTQLEVYIKKYLPQFDADLRHQFDSWMKTEDLIITS